MESLRNRFSWFDIQITIRLNPLNWHFGWYRYKFKCLDVDFGPIGVLIFYGDV